MRHILPFLWFNDQAEQAVQFYTEVFAGSSVLRVTRYGDNMPQLAGQVMTISFRLGEQEFVALNGGPHHSFTPAVSFVIPCDDQAEIDH